MIDVALRILDSMPAVYERVSGEIGRWLCEVLGVSKVAVFEDSKRVYVLDKDGKIAGPYRFSVSRTLRGIENGIRQEFHLTLIKDCHKHEKDFTLDIEIDLGKQRG